MNLVDEIFDSAERLMKINVVGTIFRGMVVACLFFLFFIFFILMLPVAAMFKIHDIMIECFREA